MIVYKKGDATLHKNGVLVQCVNDINVMGAGICIPIANRWPEVKEEYHKWGVNGFYYTNNHRVPFSLGYIQNIKVSNTLWVCNLIGQRDVRYFHGMPPVRYQSLMEGLYRLKDFMEANKLKELVSGRICAGLAGGSWPVIEKIINKVFDNSGIFVTIYDIEHWEDTLYS